MVHSTSEFSIRISKLEVAPKTQNRNMETGRIFAGETGV
jgi:hypothetical protein